MGDKAEKIREKEGSVSIDFPGVSTRDDIDTEDAGSKLKKGLFWGFSIITFGLPVLLLKTYRDFMQVEDKDEG